jgi:hypothetical protein
MVRWIARAAIAVALVAVLIALPRPVGPATAEEKFIPPNLEHAGVMACIISGNEGGDADTEVLVRYTDGTKDFRPLIARHDNAFDASEECIRWFKDIKGELKNAAKRREESR